MKNFIHHDLPKLERKTGPDGKRVYATPSGKSYPSVTTVTSLHGKQAIMEWRARVGEEEANRISSRAARRGTSIHKLCEDYLLGVNVEPDPFDKETFQQLVPWLQEINDIHCLESPLYSDHLEVAGTVDCIATFQGKLQVIDFKTSRRKKSKKDIQNYFMQCTAYALMFAERTGIWIDDIVVLIATEEGPAQVFEKQIHDYRQPLIEMIDKYA